MNPCPCGYLGHPDKACKDTQIAVDRYKSKISGPLWDRMDMHIEVPALRYYDISQSGTGEPSADVRERVKKARRRQHQRFGVQKTNGQMSVKEIKEYCPLTQDCHEVLRQAVDVMGMSARACSRLLRVSLTIADLAESPVILREHLMEAVAYRRM